MEKTCFELIFVFILWFLAFLFFLLVMFITRKDNRKYNNPNFFTMVAPISLASSIGIFAVFKLIEYSTNLNDSANIGFIMAFAMPFIASLSFINSVRTPKYDQNKVITLSSDMPLSEVVEIISERFPNVSLYEIRILNHHDGQNSYMKNRINFAEDGEKYSLPAHRGCMSLGQIVCMAKTKNESLERTRIRFLNGLPYIIIYKNAFAAH